MTGIDELLSDVYLRQMPVTIFRYLGGVEREADSVTRPNRLLVEGGVYHVYNRLGRGERVFDEEAEAAAFIGLLRDVVVRDGLCNVADACSSGTEADGGHGFSTRTHQVGPRDG